MSDLWQLSHRADAGSLPLADRHYNRQKVGSPQFVPPGRCLVLRSTCDRALWVTSWPFGEYVRHAWPGAWVNSLFRSEGAGIASSLIREAVSVTRSIWQPPELGIISFVDPKHVQPKMRRGQAIYGYCYLKAGWKHVGYTKGGLWAWQQLPDEMPAAKQLSIVLNMAVVQSGNLP